MNLETKQWSKPTIKGKIPRARAGHSATAFHGMSGTTILIFGGKCDTQYFNDVFLLDTKRMEWIETTTAGDIPSPVAFHACAAIGSNLYLFGGQGTYKILQFQFFFY